MLCSRSLKTNGKLGFWFNDEEKDEVGVGVGGGGLIVFSPLTRRMTVALSLYQSVSFHSAVHTHLSPSSSALSGSMVRKLWTWPWVVTSGAVSECPSQEKMTDVTRGLPPLTEHVMVRM